MRRPWTEIDWKAPRPNPDDIKESHRRIRFSPIAVDSPAALRLVDVFKAVLTNGGAHIAAFRVDDDETAHWFLSRNRFDEYGFVDQLLASDALADALPELAPANPDPVNAGFEEFSALMLDGSIAGALVWGGAYGKFGGSAADAKNHGAEVSRELIGDRFEDFRIDRSHRPWSAWFRAIAWDNTWVITDGRNKRVTMLCITDTD